VCEATSREKKRKRKKYVSFEDFGCLLKFKTPVLNWCCAENPLHNLVLP